MAAEVTDEELDGIYGRLVGVKSSSVETIREEERHRIRRLSIAAYRETCLRKGDQCCSVCDCCPFSQAFVEKLAELTGRLKAVNSLLPFTIQHGSPAVMAGLPISPV